MKKFINKYKGYLLSFFIPLIVLLFNCFIYTLQNGFHLSDFLYADGFGQYAPLLSYYRNNIFTKSMIYSFSKPFSGEMISTFAYYLSSPLNILIIFFKNNQIPLFFLFSSFFKICFSSLSMYIYLTKKKGSEHLSTLIFSLSYSLMSYNVCYYFNIMWLDVIALTPFILLGVDKIIKNEKSTFYILCLFFAIWSNFYISFMVCIFVFFYFLYNIIISDHKLTFDDKKKRIIKFIYSSLLGAGLAGIILFPTIITSKNFSRIPNEFYKTDYNILNNFISRLYIGVHDRSDLLSKKGAHIFYGVYCLILSTLYYFNNNIDKKKRRLSLCYLLIFIISFSFKPLFTLIQGGSLPNGYIFRYSFLFSLFMIILSFENYNNLDEINHKKKILFIFVYLLFGILSTYNKEINLNYYKVILSIAFSIIYLYLIDIDDYKKIILLLIVEEAVNINYSFLFTKSSDFSYDYNKGFEICNNIKNAKDNNYRINIDDKFIELSSYMCNTQTTDGIISTNNKSLYYFGKNVGLNTEYMGTFLSNNIGANSLLGINYILNDINTIDNNVFKKIKTLNIKNFDYISKDNVLSYELLKNNYSLGISYLINSHDIKSSTNPFIYQNNIFKKFSNIDKNIYDFLDLEKDEKFKYKLKMPDNDYLNIFLKDNVGSEKDFSEININDRKFFIRYGNRGILTIKNAWKNEYVDISVKMKDKYKRLYKDSDFSIAILNQDNFSEIIDELNDNILDIKKIYENILEGKINSTKDGYLFMSIPYDKNFKIYVNGKSKKIYKTLDTFMSVKIKKGVNNIKVIYVPNELYVGMIISSISLLLILFNYRYEKKKII